jgi:hypothetical protein
MRGLISLAVILVVGLLSCTVEPERPSSAIGCDMDFSSPLLEAYGQFKLELLETVMENL